MSRFRRALAAAAMAAAAAGGGLLIAVAGTVPAHASAPAAPALKVPPPAGYTFAMTAKLGTQGAGGLGSQDTLPCAVKGATCLPPTITCTLFVDKPSVSPVTDTINSNVDVRCSAKVPAIDLHDALLNNGISVDVGGDPARNDFEASNLLSVGCLAGTYSATADALITPPDGYVVTQGTNPLILTSPSLPVGPFCTTGDGGGGGGGCATATPPVPAQPAARHPDVIACP